MPSFHQLLSTAYATLVVWGAPVVCAPWLVSRRHRKVAFLYLALYVLCAALYVYDDDDGAQHVVMFGVALLYFAALAWLLHRHAKLLVASATKPALFALSVIAFLLLPAFTWPHGLNAAFLPFAWETSLAAFSYCVESGSASERPSRTETLFFLLVDPTLVYLDGERAVVRAQPVAWPRPLLRVLLSVALAGPASLLFQERHRVAAWLSLAPSGVPATIGQGALLFFAFYTLHSVLASLRIGMTRLLGYDVHERYNYPFLARSPLDFWNRWNTYIGAWSKYYVFYPVAAFLRRKRRLRPIAPAAALLSTMLAVGALHDVFVYAAVLRADLTFTRYFFLAALLMLAWNAIPAFAAQTSASSSANGRKSAASWLRPLVLTGAAQLVVWFSFGWLSP